MNEYRIIYLENGVTVRKTVKATDFKITGEFGNMIARFYRGQMLVYAYSNVIIVERCDIKGEDE